jgi:hypothetical protein
MKIDNEDYDGDGDDGDSNGSLIPLATTGASAEQDALLVYEDSSVERFENSTGSSVAE